MIRAGCAKYSSRRTSSGDLPTAPPMPPCSGPMRCSAFPKSCRGRQLHKDQRPLFGIRGLCCSTMSSAFRSIMLDRGSSVSGDWLDADPAGAGPAGGRSPRWPAAGRPCRARSRRRPSPPGVAALWYTRRAASDWFERSYQRPALVSGPTSADYPGELALLDVDLGLLMEVALSRSCRPR